MFKTRGNNEMDTATDFRSKCKEIRDAIYAEAEVYKVTGKTFRDVLFSVAEKNSIVQKCLKDIQTFTDLVDVLDRDGRMTPPVEITPSAVERAAAILKLLKAPPLVLPMFKTDVLHFRAEDNIKDVVLKMQKLSYSQAPVLGMNGVIEALLTTDTIVRWLAQHLIEDRKFLKLREAPLGDVLVCAESSSTGAKPFDTISPKTNCIQVLKAFEQAQTSDCRLDALIITDDGTKNGKIVGIITGWDLPKVVRETSVNRIIEEAAGAKKVANATSFTLEGSTYRIRFKGKEWTVKKCAGSAYLHELLYNPKKEFRSTELISRLSGKYQGLGKGGAEESYETSFSTASGASSNVDPSMKKAFDEYFKEMKDIDAEITELQRDDEEGNQSRIAELVEEKNAILAHVGPLKNIRGLPRQFKSSDNRGDTIRRAITRCLSQSVSKANEPAKTELVAHVKNCIKFGIICEYLPPPAVEWQ